MINKCFALVMLYLMTFSAWSISARGDQLYSIAEQVARDERLTTMNALLSRFEDLQALLDDDAGEFTLLAPIDGAWTYVDAEGVEVDLLAAIADPLFAEALLRYYIVPTNLGEAGYNSPIEYGTMLPGYTIAATYTENMQPLLNYSSLPIDGLPVPAENGRILLLDSGLPISTFSAMGRVFLSPANIQTEGVILPPEADRSVIDALTEAGTFTYMLRLLETYPHVSQRLELGAYHTLLAPTDAALQASGYAALLEEYLGDTSEESYGARFLATLIWPGYFDLASLRRLVGQDGRIITLQTLDSYGVSTLTTIDDETGTIDQVLRINGNPINEQPILANKLIIYVQEQLDPPG